MISNYFKIAWRNLWKNKLFSFINIVGLGLAIPFALLSLMQVQSAYEYDNFHPKSDRIYRVITHIKDANGKTTGYGSSPNAVADALATNYPFLEEMTHTNRAFGWELSDGVKTLEVNTLFVDHNFFDLFAFPLKEGSIPDAPNTLVLSREMAKIFFGDSDPIGKTLSHPDYGDLTVTGVLEHYKENTHFRSDVMVSSETFKDLYKDEANNQLNGYTYVLMNPISDERNLQSALVQIAENINELHPDSKEELHFESQAFSKISPDFRDLEDNPYVESLRDLSVNLMLAFVILLLAGFNYTNLTLAQSINRAKEVGIRKVAGANRKQLIVQFICEAILMASLALIFGYLVLQIMHRFIHVNWITWQVDHPFLLWMIFISFTIITGIFAGVVPAYILSGFKPVDTLKGKVSPASFGKMGFRKSLVVIQLVVTACFIFLIVNMYSQFKFMATDNTNFNRQHIYNILVKDNFEPFLNNVAENKDVERIGLASRAFGGSSEKYAAKREKLEENVAVNYFAVDANFILNMNLDFLAGQNLPDTKRDSLSPFVVLNEKALFALGMGNPKEAIGTPLILNDTQQAIVRGVVRDFCYSNYQFATEPLIMQYDPSQFRLMSIKTKGEIDEKHFKSEMELLWKKQFPYKEMGFSNFERDLYERYYPGADMRFLGMVSMIIFVIAILGLLGIVTYTVEKRYKEIGIRKVIGASIFSIIKELSYSFLKLIVLATVICVPLGYLIAYLFIDFFAFNDGINISLMSGMYAVIFFIALLAIIVMAAKAALANPIKSLRTE